MWIPTVAVISKKRILNHKRMWKSTKIVMKDHLVHSPFCYQILSMKKTTNKINGDFFTGLASSICCLYKWAKICFNLRWFFALSKKCSPLNGIPWTEKLMQSSKTASYQGHNCINWKKILHVKVFDSVEWTFEHRIMFDILVELKPTNCQINIGRIWICMFTLEAQFLSFTKSNTLIYLKRKYILFLIFEFY